MLNIQGVAAGRGYVRSAFSRRVAAQVIALDLVRANLKAVRAGLRKNEIARVSAAFSGYLWTDEELAIEAALVPPFTARRSAHAPYSPTVLATGYQIAENGGDLDAPEWIAAGAMSWVDGYGPFPSSFGRGGWK